MLRKLQVELGIRDVVFLEPLLDLFFFVVGLEHLVNVQIALPCEHPVGQAVLTPAVEERLLARSIFHLVAQFGAPFVAFGHLASIAVIVGLRGPLGRNGLV